MKILGLTTPITRGPAVEHAQRSMKAPDVIGFTHKEIGEFYNGPIDGKFDQDTANAARRAHLFLGFPLSEVKERYGENLDAYLNGKRKLSTIMKLRRRRRLKQAAQRKKDRRNIKVRALEIALKERGTHEYPTGSNRVKYSEWYGIIGPWCAMFFTWCEVQAAEQLHVKTDWKRGSFAAYCPAIVEAAAHHQHGLSFTSDPEPGDAVLYDWPGVSKGTADHVGRFVKWVNRSTGTFEAVEGNTSETSQDNGGEVMLRTRSRTLVQHFIKLDE